jgi:20S proteasome alpha/beta subunit
MEEKIRNDLVEVHVITKDEPYQILNKEQVDELLKHLKELN